MLSMLVSRSEAMAAWHLIQIVDVLHPPLVNVQCPSSDKCGHINKISAQLIYLKYFNCAIS